MKITACPLDCYDSCKIIYKNNKLIGDKNHIFTNGILCYKLSHYFDFKQLDSAYYKGDKISLKKALDILEERLRKSKNILYFRGSGNIAKMQGVTELFFAKIGATFAKGSLCDEAGQIGIKKSRGYNVILPLEQIRKSELVIVWGRNINYTNSHLLQFIKNKKIVVIDPVKIDIVKSAILHLQITPKNDLNLALLLSKIILSKNIIDEKKLYKENNYIAFKNILKTIDIKSTTRQTGIILEKIEFLANLMLKLKTVILVGNGVQKYYNGSEVLRAIDSLGMILGLFGKEGCGVSFLGDTMLDIENPFGIKTKTISKPEVDFKKFDTVFIQGSNPVVTMPNSKKVIKGLKKSFSIVLGIYLDETAKIADLVIPAKNFLQKNDIRFSYGIDCVQFMPKILDDNNKIDEYQFTKEMFGRFKLSGLKSEDYYLNCFKNQLIGNKLPSYEKNPYKFGFKNRFNFLDSIIKFNDKKQYFLITPKYKNGLNSQFKVDNYLYISPFLGFKDGENVIVKSEYGDVKMVVKISDKIKKNFILAYSGSKINYITPDKSDINKSNAIFQEVSVKLIKI